MDVKNAIAAAKGYVKDVYEETERISDVSLEEVEFDHANDQWLITVEFSRPMAANLRTRAREVLDAASGVDTYPHRRVQKIVIVSGEDGKFVGLKNREAA